MDNFDDEMALFEAEMAEEEEEEKKAKEIVPTFGVIAAAPALKSAEEKHTQQGVQQTSNASSASTDSNDNRKRKREDMVLTAPLPPGSAKGKQAGFISSSSFVPNSAAIIEEGRIKAEQERVEELKKQLPEWNQPPKEVKKNPYTEILPDEPKKPQKYLRAAAGKIWEDKSLAEWPESDHRIFCGDLGNEVNDNTLAKVFVKYSSFAKAKVVRDNKTQKTKGYGFVSFTDLYECQQALKEMQGCYVGNRPIKLKKSKWDKRNYTEKGKKGRKRNHLY